MEDGTPGAVIIRVLWEGMDPGPRVAIGFDDLDLEGVLLRAHQASGRLRCLAHLSRPKPEASMLRRRCLGLTKLCDQPTAIRACGEA
jgi:hypothetical protein